MVEQIIVVRLISENEIVKNGFASIGFAIMQMYE